MSLILHFHPLSSFCMKVLIGLYELEVPFEKHIVHLGDAESRAAFLKLWPVGKFPVLRDEARGVTVPETTIILEYIEKGCGARGSLLPEAPDVRLLCRQRDRFYDLYVNVPLGKIVTDKLRPENAHDPFGVEQAKEELETAYGVADDWMRDARWAAGDVFTLADCAAAPALFYANKVLPFRRHRGLAAYLERLEARPSFARVLSEAEPYFSLFPG